MSILRVDIRPVLAQMNDAIDRWESDGEWGKDTAACVDRIWILTGQIPTLFDRKTFADHVRKVLSCGRPDLARSLIFAMSPTDWTRGAHLTGRVLWYLLKLSVLVGLVAAVVEAIR